MSYSNSWEAGLIKVEVDNSLSCSLEFATLVIPWEIIYVLCIKFVSLPVSHGHIFLLLLLCVLSVLARSIFRHAFLSFVPLLCSFFFFFLLFFYSLYFLSLSLSLYLSPKTPFLHLLCLSPSLLFTNTALYIPPALNTETNFLALSARP